MELQRQSVVFLYSRLPDYFYQCIVRFTALYDYKAVIVMYKGDVNTEYVFSNSANVTLYYKDDIDNLITFVQQLGPKAIYLSGWGDKVYKLIGKIYSKHIPVILGLDNPWEATLKQRIFCFLSPFYLQPVFNKVWVAGIHQYIYAERLGFKPINIMQGLYAADDDKFINLKPANTLHFENTDNRKILLFVGRMVEYKQPHVIAAVFNELQEECPMEYKDWKLVMAGEGPLRQQIASQNYTNVELTGFVSPQQLPEFYKRASVFCFPSINEHWGVVVQEAALSGLPLLLSDTVYAGYSFLIQGFNGFRFKSGNRKSLKESLAQCMRLNTQDLWQQGQNSIIMGNRISKNNWAASLKGVLI